MFKKIIAISTVAVAIMLFLGVMLFVETGITCAQTQAGCSPLHPSIKGWAKGSTVYYDVSGIPTGKRQENVIKAFTAWNTANASNGSGVNFQPSSAQHPATFTVTVGTAGGNPAQVMTTAPTGTVVSAAAQINLNDTTLFDPNMDGFSESILKAMLHEIGHTMGLNDMPIPNPTGNCGDQTSGESVMNSYCGTNDYGGNMPTTVKDCDNRSVKNNPQYQTPTPTPTPTPGGGDCLDSLGCGDECPCGNCETGCDPPDPTCDWWYPPMECVTVCEIDDYGQPENCSTECYQDPPVYYCY
jgi:hypothetical protein